MIDDVDAIIIGSGQGGVPLAVALAKDGKRVVLFERDEYGGSCVNYGCTPSKAFLAAAHNAGRARAAAPLGVHCEVTIDGPAALGRVREVRGEWRASSRKRLEDSPVRLVHAEGRFTGTRTVEGGGESFRAPLVVIDTGTRATIPPIDGLEGTPYLTNVSWWEIPTVPKSLIVLGGGYIGLELGQGARRLGSEVTIVEASPRPMAHEEADAVDVVVKSLEHDGVRFALGSKARSVRHADGEFTVTLENGTTLTADALLVASGRTPNTEALDCARSGIELTDHGMVKTDEYLRTTCEGVYAIGDVAGQPAFTHVSWEDHRRLLATLAGTPRRRDDRVLSYTTFTEPQLARTGLTKAQAKERGIAATSRTMQLADTARGEEWNLPQGFYRFVVDTKTDKLIGATLVGYEAGEIVHVLTAHLELGAFWRDLDRQMYVHPTFSENLPSIARLFDED